MKTPTLSAVLKSLPTATCWTWFRGSNNREGSLSIQHESISEDWRECTDVCFHGHCIEVRVARLSGFDKAKDRWMRHDSESKGDLPTRAGEKALREFIAAYARAKAGVPNPTSVSYYADRDSTIQQRINEAARAALA